MGTKQRKGLAVIAIGGNSLIKDKFHQTVEDQYLAARETTQRIADMIEDGWDAVITHGNGPQVGFILQRSEIAHKVARMHEVPLEVCDADSQGAIGYALQQNLQNELFMRHINKPCVTLITQVRVEMDDPAFANPTKPIGSFMSEAEARERADEGWKVIQDAGRGWRRLVASPQPVEIVELDSIRVLINAGVIIIAVGGGGIPVIDRGGGEYVGIPAVVDKDYASSLLARMIKADLFLISTAVEKVALNYGKPDQQWIDRMTVSQARAYLTQGTHFAGGSMEPKIQSCIWYLEDGGRLSVITNPENLWRALKGETGTWIVPG
jgi:carbamate kinase